MALFAYLSMTKSLYFFICVYKHGALKNNEAFFSDVKDKNTLKIGKCDCISNAKSSENG